MQNSIYKISGRKRREVKKRLGELKSFVKYYWFYHQLDKDMYYIYTNGANNNLITDEQAKIIYNNANEEIKKIEEKLSETIYY